MGGMHDNADHLQKLGEWMRSYKPEELFDENGTLVPELKALAPQGNRRMSANPHANGGLLRRALKMPNFRDYAIQMEKHGVEEFENTKVLGFLMRDIFRDNPDNFRLMGPDETASNRLQDVYEVTKKSVDGRDVPGRRAGRRTLSRWAGDGNAQRAYAARLVRRLLAQWASWLVPHL